MYAVKTALLLSLMTVLLVGGAWLVTGSPDAAGIALGFAALFNLFAYLYGDRVVLRMYRAREVGPDDAPRLHATVEELAARAGVPKPRVYVIPDASPNAFATGRGPRHASVAVTEGILSLLTPRELRGVLAHEMSHVANRDILVGTVAATLAGAVAWLGSMARWGMLFGGGHDRGGDRGANAIGAVLTMVFALFAGLAATLIQLAVSRAREFGADATGARLSSDPLALADALRKLSWASGRVPMDASQATAHMFIVNPLTAGGALSRLFSTHPDPGERVARLEAMAFGAALGR